MAKNLLAGLWRGAPRWVRRAGVLLTQARFTVTAAVVATDERGRVLLLKHVFRGGSGWGIPGGFLEAGEQPEEAARRERQRGATTYFLTGTDEHGVNIQRAAAREGRTPKEQVDFVVEELKKMFAAYNKAHYHQPSDEYRESWDLSGMIEEIEIAIAIGRKVADATEMPRYNPGDEFAKSRQP